MSCMVHRNQSCYIPTMTSYSLHTYINAFWDMLTPFIHKHVRQYLERFSQYSWEFAANALWVYSFYHARWCGL